MRKMYLNETRLFKCITSLHLILGLNLFIDHPLVHECSCETSLKNRNRKLNYWAVNCTEMFI